MDVEAGREVHGRAHGAELVDAHEVVLERDGGRGLGVELARDGVVLDIERLGVGADYDVGFHGGGAAAGAFLEGDAVDRARVAGGRGEGSGIKGREVGVGAASFYVLFLGLHASHIRWGGKGRRRGRRDAEEVNEDPECGVGCTDSPVIRTRASIPPHNSFRAVTGVRVKTSRLFGDGGGEFVSCLRPGISSPRSADGSGLGGIMRVNESAESWTVSETAAVRVGDISSGFIDATGRTGREVSLQQRNAPVITTVSPPRSRGGGGLMIDDSSRGVQRGTFSGFLLVTDQRAHRVFWLKGGRREEGGKVIDGGLWRSSDPPVEVEFGWARFFD